MGVLDYKVHGRGVSGAAQSGQEGGECHVDENCDDEDDCTDNFRDAGTRMRPYGTSNATRGGETTSDCNDRDPCTEDVCEEGMCKNIPLEKCDKRKSFRKSRWEDREIG